MKGPIRTRVIESGGFRHTQAVSICPSVRCLPDLVAEIDAMDHEPSEEERDEMVARFKKIEATKWSGPRGVIAVKMVNRTMIDSTIRAKAARKTSEDYRNRGKVTA
jgi:hypothetical protein